jgi:hypothetical protein
MARQERSTTFAQESTRPITQVALYARVSTSTIKTLKCNSRNCENMQSAAAGRLSRNSRTMECPAPRSPGHRLIG